MLRRVFAAENVAAADAAALDRRAMTGRDVVDVRVRPRLLGPDEAWQPPAQVIRDEATDQVALGERPRSVHNARVDADQGGALANLRVGQTVGGHLGALVVVRLERDRRAARRQRDERRRVDDAWNAVKLGGGDHIAEAAHVHLVEILAPPPPDADERRRMRDRIAARNGALQRAGIANVAVNRSSRQTAAAGGAREDDRLVSSGGERTDDRRVVGPEARRVDPHVHRHAGARDQEVEELSDWTGCARAHVVRTRSYTAIDHDAVAADCVADVGQLPPRIEVADDDLGGAASAFDVGDLPREIGGDE